MAAAVRHALDLLGVERFVLQVPDSAFPWSPGEDLGRGSPNSVQARAFMRGMTELGFDTIQLMPGGRTSPVNHSPYDGSLFARNEMSISHHRLCEFAPESAAELNRVLDWDERTLHAPRERVDHGPVWHRIHGWLEQVARVLRSRQHPWEGAFERWRMENRWLEIHSSDDLDPLIQFLAHQQHLEMKAEAAQMGLQLWGDLQVGMGPDDAAVLAPWLLVDYRMGAPPSRTNPEGQPWGFPVFDPRHLEPGGPAHAVLRARLDKLATEYDGIRIDHPHGWVCPWVYRVDAGQDPAEAVRAGARLHESPALPDHPGLAAYARVRADQVRSDPNFPRYADDWVTGLEEAQIDRYEAHLALMRDAMGGVEHLACEVLSTEPLPLRRVRQRLGLGRFLVTQKADPDDPEDVYRSERARPADWIMMGNHDTPTLWGRIRSWSTHRRRREVEDLLRRFPHVDSESLMDSDDDLVRLELADALASPARNVLVFFGDLYGFTEPYNRPGIVSDANWCQRVPEDWRRIRLDLSGALSDALRARGIDDASVHDGLSSVLASAPCAR